MPGYGFRVFSLMIIGVHVSSLMCWQWKSKVLFVLLDAKVSTFSLCDFMLSNHCNGPNGG